MKTAIENKESMIQKLTTRRKAGVIIRKPRRDISSEESYSTDNTTSTSNSVESLSNERKSANRNLKNNLNNNNNNINNTNNTNNLNNNNNLGLTNDIAEEAKKLFSNDKIVAFSKKKNLNSRTMVISRKSITSVIYSKNDEKERKNIHILGNSLTLTLPIYNCTGEFDLQKGRNHHSSDSKKKIKRREKRITTCLDDYFKEKSIPKKSEIIKNLEMIRRNTPPPLPSKKSKPLLEKKKMLIQVKSGSFCKYFKIDPHITVKAFLDKMHHHIPKLHQFIDHIGGKLTLCLPNNQNYVFSDVSEFELFQYIKANSSYFLPMDKTFESMKHIISQAVKKKQTHVLQKKKKKKKKQR